MAVIRSPDAIQCVPLAVVLRKNCDLGMVVIARKDTDLHFGKGIDCYVQYFAELRKPGVGPAAKIGNSDRCLRIDNPQGMVVIGGHESRSMLQLRDTLVPRLRLGTHHPQALSTLGTTRSLAASAFAGGAWERGRPVNGQGEDLALPPPVACLIILTYNAVSHDFCLHHAKASRGE